MIVFFYVVHVARRAGIDEAAAIIASNERVHLTASSSVAGSLDKPLWVANEDGGLHLLTQTKDLVIVFLTRPGKSPQNHEKLHVFVLKRADLLSVDLHDYE